MKIKTIRIKFNYFTLFRDRQYRYRFFSERSQEDVFDGMQDLPVYRDTTVSLQFKDQDANLLDNQYSNAKNYEQADSTTTLTSRDPNPQI